MKVAEKKKFKTVVFEKQNTSQTFYFKSVKVKFFDIHL